MSNPASNDPRRCKAVNRTGQCGAMAIDGSNYCSRHNARGETQEEKDLATYIVDNTELATALAKHNRRSKFKSLEDEVSLVRALIEQRLRLINTSADMMAACGPINTLLLTLEKLTTSLFKLEQSMGNLLSKSEVLDIAQALAAIVKKELEGVEDFEAIVDRVNERFMKLVLEAGAE